MQKTNLLYIITKLELGGAQKQLLSLITSLNQDKFNLFLFTAQEGLLVEDVLSITGLKLKRSLFLERNINLLKDLLALIEIYFFIKKNKIDIVHTHSSKAGVLGRLAARLAKVKLILHTVHGWSFHDYQSGLVKRLFIWLEKIAASFTDKLIVVSNYDKQKGLNNGIGDEDKYVLIHYGIEVERFSIKHSNVRGEFGLSPDDLVVGMISCFKPQKAPFDFIKVASLVNKELPGVKFLLVGDGVLRKEIERLIYKFNLQDKVILTGWRRDIPQLLSAIDVFVLTSLWEGLPISVLEAMAASKPVIATNTGGVTEVIIEGKTGFLVEPKDIQAMNERLIQLLGNEPLRKRYGQNAKDYLGSDFSLLNMSKHTQDVYEKSLLAPYFPLE